MNQVAQAKVVVRLPGAYRLLIRLVLAVVIFGSGVAVGIGGYQLYLDRRADYYRSHPEEAPTRFADKLTDRLDLNTEQARKVKQIVIEQWPGFQRIRNDMYPRMKVQTDQLRPKLAGVLNDKQLREWDEWRASFERSYQLKPQGPASGPATMPSSAPRL
jgi:hypothetical protein